MDTRMVAFEESKARDRVNDGRTGEVVDLGATLVCSSD